MITRIESIVVLAITLILVPMVVNATPVMGGPDDHYYEVVVANDVTWADANSAATAASHLGVSGHLVTTTSQLENDFVDSVRQPILGDYLPTAKSEAWMGGFQVSGCDPEPGCGWTWVNNEGTIPGVASYVNWQNGEPNDVGQDEDQMTLGRYIGGEWNDSRVANGNIGGYIIEYDTVVPAATDDPGNEANSGEEIQIDVLANDELNGQDVTSINVPASPLPNGGTVRVDACISPAVSELCVFYTSAPGYGQVDSFVYTVSSGGLESDEATVTINVNGTVSVTPPGDDIVVFGGAENGVPLLATGEFADASGESSIKCCTIRDPRVRLKKRRNGSDKIIHRGYPFDIGDAMDSSLADDCSELPQPDRYKLIVPGHFSVHTEVDNSLDPDDYRFGLCVVETTAPWLGIVNLDVDAEPAVGYQVDCTRQGVSNQPITLGLTTFPEEYNAPFMRPVTIECDPRGAPKWSTWYFIPNAVHLTKKWPSKLYALGRIFVLRLVISAMDSEGAVDSALLSDVDSKVVAARNILLGPSSQASAALMPLDDAGEQVLTPGVQSGVFPGSNGFPNPKGELASHLLALRYAVCSELAFANMPGSCKVPAQIENLLPALPSP